MKHSRETLVQLHLMLSAVQTAIEDVAQESPCSCISVAHLFRFGSTPLVGEESAPLSYQTAKKKEEEMSGTRICPNNSTCLCE